MIPETHPISDFEPSDPPKLRTFFFWGGGRFSILLRSFLTSKRLFDQAQAREVHMGPFGGYSHSIPQGVKS